MTTPHESKKPKTQNIIGDRYVSYKHRHQPVDDLGGIEALVRIALFIAFLLLIFYLTYILPQLFTILNRTVPNKFVLALIGAIGSFTTGLSLYYFRQRKRMYYSLLEIAFGIITGGVGILRVSEQGDLSVWLALSASAYLIVRGLDNLQTPREQKAETKFLGSVEVTPSAASCSVINQKADCLNLGGHLKSGHVWSLENRP